MWKRKFDNISHDASAAGPHLESYGTTPSLSAEPSDATDMSVDNSSLSLAVPSTSAASWSSRSSVEAGASPLVCYGALKGVSIRLFEATYETIIDNINTTEKRLFLPIEPVKSIMVIKHVQSHKDVGVLNMHLTSIFLELRPGSSLQIQAVLPTNLEVLYQDSIRKNRSHTRELACEVLVLGTVEGSRSMGDKLATKMLFLQRPTECPAAYQYNNPQWLDLGVLVADFKDNGDSDEDMLDLDVTTKSKAHSDDEQDELEYNDHSWDDIYQHIHAKTEQETIIKTRLRDHQKEALHFMLQHEDPGSPVHDTLWKMVGHQSRGSSYYTHRIVHGIERARPDKFLGGILADNMGLGKTLSVLSLMANTLVDARKTQSDASSTNCVTTSATLVIVPSALILDSWSSEIKTHFSPKTINVSHYHGHRREQNLQRVFKSDVVLTTYATVTADYFRRRRHLYNAIWFRVVLDEAHLIRSRQTKQFSAITALNASRRWCITGTPIQNQMDDLGALMSFLKVPLFEQPKVFNRHIAMNHSLDSLTNRSTNARKLISSLCLRRTKQVVEVPHPIYVETPLTFSEEEKIFYTEVVQDSKRLFMEASSNTGNFKSIINYMHKLRIVCNEGCSSIGQIHLQAAELFASVTEAPLQRCDACTKQLLLTSMTQGDDESIGFQTLCGHVLCSSCLSSSGEELRVDGKTQEMICLACNSSIARSLDRTIEQHDAALKLDGIATSSKIDALTRSILGLSPNTKSIVFSGWRRSLELAASVLRASSVSVHVVHGDVSVAERRTVLEAFKKATEKVVLMMTLGSGGEGLTLIDATHIYILEPQWNPQAERQAIARAVRMGQQRQVVVTKFYIEGSIEESVRDQQQTKLRLARSNFEDISESEIRNIFSRLVEAATKVT